MNQYNDNPTEAAAFDRFVDLMAKLMIKYGPTVLKKRKEKLIEAICASMETVSPISAQTVLKRLEAYHNAVAGIKHQMKQ